MDKKDIQLYKTVHTPAYVVDKQLLINNLKKLKYVQDETGCKILLALKGFSMHSVFPIVGDYLTGTTSSSLFEAKLGREYMNKEVHIYAPAYRPDEIDTIINTCDHIVFNSPAQFQRFKSNLNDANKTVSCGIRVNPEYSEVDTEIYDPCAINSRLGTVASKLTSADFTAVDGLHFHTMCEQNSDTLERTLAVIEDKFGDYLHTLKWVNFGGGHHITRDDYDIDRLIALIKNFMAKYNVMVYLEPGEAVALNCGFLVATVLDVIENNLQLVILDTSAACHMPDVLEMPYRPHIIGSGKANEKDYTYRLGGLTCLAGDVLGDYSFDTPLQVGDKLIFTDMAHYSMVKNNTFNGVNLPDIVLRDNETIEVIRQFKYDDFKGRLS